MRRSVPCSMPFARLTIAAPGAMCGRASASTARKPCDGTANTTTSAPAHAVGEVGGRAQLGGQRDAGQVVGVLVLGVDARRELGAPRPQHGRRVAGDDRRDRRAPRPGADHRDSRHAVLRCAPAVLGIAPPPRVVAGAGAPGRSRARARRTRRSRPSCRSVVCFTCSSGAATIGSPITAVCATPHCQCGLRPLVRIRCVPHRPTGVIGDAGAAREPRGARLADHRLEILARSCPRGTRRRTRRGRSASTAGVERVGGVGAAPAHRDLVRGAQQRTEHRLVEQLGLGEEPHVPAAAVGDPRERQRIEIRHVVAREHHRARRSGCCRAPSIVQCKPHRNQGENTPFATEYTGSTIGSIRRPCRPGAFPTPQASSSRCGRSHSARPASRTRSTTTRAARSRARWPNASSPPPAPRPVVIVSSAPEVIAWAHALGLAHIADPGTLDGAADAGREWVRDRGLARRRRDARRPPARDDARRHRRRRRRAGRGARSRPSRRRQPGARDPERAPTSRSRTAPARAPATSPRRGAAASRCASSAIARSASTSTTRPISPRSPHERETTP